MRPQTLLDPKLDFSSFTNKCSPAKRFPLDRRSVTMASGSRWMSMGPLGVRARLSMDDPIHAKRRNYNMGEFNGNSLYLNGV